LSHRWETRASRPSSGHAEQADVVRTMHLSVRRAAAELGVDRSVLHRARLSLKPAETLH